MARDIGAAGMPGKTAFMAWKEIADAKKGETAFVSAGSGPVGQMVIQIAKADGMKVKSSLLTLTVESDIRAQLLQEFDLVVASGARNDLHAISLGNLRRLLFRRTNAEASIPPQTRQRTPRRSLPSTVPLTSTGSTSVL
jgi:hypothetical protein